MPSFRSRLVVILSLVLSNTLHSQLFEMSSDARSISLGQVYGGYDGFNSTCQFLSSKQERSLELEYGSRPVNWFSFEDMRYWHASLIFVPDQSQFFRFDYQRFDAGEFNVTGPTGPEVIDTKSPHEDLMSFSYGRELFDGLSLNLTYKFYKQSDYPDFESSTLANVWRQASAHVGDLTLAYRQSFISERNLTTRVVLVAGISNFGTWIVDDKDRLFPITRFGRVGMIVSNALLNSEGNRIMSAILTINYRRLLNMPESSWRNYWSGGVELGAYDMVFLRAGLRVDPFASVYGPSDKALGSYGVGLKLPLEMISRQLNGIVLKFDYTAVPLDLENPSGLSSTPEPKYNKTYGASITYNWSRGDIF
jgi:hypothetical protein